MKQFKQATNKLEKMRQEQVQLVKKNREAHLKELNSKTK
jgi:hypothetical protein